MKKSSLMLHFLMFAVITILGFVCSSKFTMSNASQLISVMQNGTAMIFTVLGIWLAYIYPNVILKITQPDKFDVLFTEEDSQSVTMIVSVIICSAFIMVALIIGSAAWPIVSAFDFLIQNRDIIKGVGLSSLLILVYVLLCCIYLVIITNLNFLIHLKNQQNKRELEKKLGN